jgi:hypothetical protein
MDRRLIAKGMFSRKREKKGTGKGRYQGIGEPVIAEVLAIPDLRK